MTDPAGSFDDLPAEERVARLQRLAERALERYDIPAPSLELITNDWNCVFRVDAADGTRSVVRVSLPGRRSPDEVRGEMAWLASLAADGSVSVPVPMAARDGSLVVEEEADEVSEARMVAVFSWVEGEQLTNAMTERNIEAYGEVAARLHTHAAGFEPPPGMKIWDSPYPFLEPEVLFDAEHRGTLGATGAAPFERARAATGEVIERLADAEPPRMIHADLHEENAFVRQDGSVAVLDFDDCMVGWPVQDLGITVFALANLDDFRVLERALRRGYERVAPWPERVPGEVRVFVANRCLMLSNYIVQDHDPTYLAEAEIWVRRWAARIDLLLA